MSLWDMLVEGLIEGREIEHSVSQEDMDWYIENTYVDPMERVE